jgi:hypothetical protein
MYWPPEAPASLCTANGANPLWASRLSSSTVSALPPLVLELLELFDDEELLLEDDELEELLLDDEELELLEPPQPEYTDAHCEVCVMPLVPLIRRLPQLERWAGLKLITMSSEVQQLPLPDHDQPT